MGYELLAHTADIKVALRAPDLAGLYQAAADMVREVLVGSSAVAEEVLLVIPPEGAAPSEAFFRFVRELFYLYDVERFLPSRVVGLSPPTVAGEAFDPERHVPQRQVKAVTRHQYDFRGGRGGRGGYTAEMVLDL